jgi:DNA-binding HxlR family transcriptional regulator
MKQRVVEQKSGCIEAALKVVGNKWTALIIRELTTGPRRFAELQRALLAISPRTLSARLDELAQVGIVSREAFAEVPPRVVYTLTPKGYDLVPILQQMADWGYQHYPASDEAPLDHSSAESKL